MLSGFHGNKHHHKPVNAALTLRAGFKSQTKNKKHLSLPKRDEVKNEFS